MTVFSNILSRAKRGMQMLDAEAQKKAEEAMKKVPKRKPESIDDMMRRGVENAPRDKTNRMHSASVDLTEAQWAARPAGTRSIARPEAGPKANDIGRKSGRGYYHPDRIRERALRRDEQWQRQAIRRRSA